MGIRHRGVLLVGVIAGCAQPTAPPLDTGAKEAARCFYDALCRQDWTQAYSALHPESRAQCSPEHFGRLARSYYRGLGFIPEAVHVRSCAERGTEAIAHVVLKGQMPSQRRQYKDGIVLRPNGDGWAVILPPYFGRSKTS